MIGSKAENYKLYQAGAYGNKLRTWDSYEDLKNSSYTGLLVIRYKVANSPHCAYGVKLEELENQIAKMESNGARRELMTFNELAPDERLTIQGEVMCSPNHYTVLYSDEKLPMRPALKAKSMQVEGLEAMMLLKSQMEPNSYEDLQELIGLYPNCVIEFSCYSITLGSCARRNTIFWEVRAY